MTPALVGVFAAVLFGAIAYGLYAVGGRILSPVMQPVERAIPDLGVHHERFAIPSGGGDLSSWLMRPNEAQPFEPLVVLAHGWSANHSTVLRLAEPLVKGGHEVLVFDVRGHGENRPLKEVTVKDFRDDVLAVTRYASKRFPDRQLVLIGHSMGGAAGVLAAADGAPIDGLILIASPSDVLTVTAEFLNEQGKPGGLLVNLLRPVFWWKLRSTLRPLTPSRRIRELDLPLLILQPELDRRVPKGHAVRLSEASGIPYQEIPSQTHTEVLSDPATLEFVEEFLEAL